MYDPLWRCADGRMLKVGQMSDKHLNNAIAKIQRSKNWRKEWLDRLQLELTIRSIKRR